MVQRLLFQTAKAKDELNTLFKPVQSVGKGVDPKSVVCLFFKQGQCTKGDKCKFSHDLTIARYDLRYVVMMVKHGNFSNIGYMEMVKDLYI